MTTNIVFYDLETTGLLGSNPQILEIGAVTLNDEKFNVFCNPYKNIEESASAVNKLYNREGKLYKNDVELNTISEKESLENLITWIKQISTTQVIYFMAYNAKFDQTITLAKVKEYGLEFPLNVKWKCLQKMVCKKLRAVKYIKFNEALKIFDINFKESEMHSALVDSQFNKKLFLKMSENF